MKKNFRRVIGLAGACAVTLHVVNKIIEEQAVSKNILSTLEGHEFNWKYGRIFYTKQGKGSPILLVHDLTPESSAYEWKNLISKLSKTNTVYAIDLLGCGRSEKPNITYTNFLYVQLINDFARQVIKNETTLVVSGHSSSFAIMATTLMPNTFNHLVLINPDGPYENNALAKKNNPLCKIISQIPILSTSIYNFAMSRNRIHREVLDLFITKKYYKSSEMIDACYEGAHLGHCKGKYLMASIMGDFTNVDIKNAFSKMETPVLVMQSEGRCEKNDALEQLKDLNDSIKTFRFNSIAGRPHQEATTKTYELILKEME